MADVATGPEGDPLPAVEEFGCLVIDHRDRHLGVVARVQGLFVIPADLGREDPGTARTAQPGSLAITRRLMSARKLYREAMFFQDRGIDKGGIRWLARMLAPL